MESTIVDHVLFLQKYLWMHRDWVVHEKIQLLIGGSVLYTKFCGLGQSQALTTREADVIYKGILLTFVCQRVEHTLFLRVIHQVVSQAQSRDQSTLTLRFGLIFLSLLYIV